MSLKNLTSSSFIINFTLFLSGILAFPWPGTDSGSYYYKEENIDQEILIENGIKIKRWLTTNSSEGMLKNRLTNNKFLLNTLFSAELPQSQDCTVRNIYL